MPDLREQFWNSILEIAKTNKDVIILVGDLGFSFYEQFKEELPDQFINCGIAEQNMIGVASGLALAGKKPYCYSNSIFLLMRAYEQVRDDVCFNQANVKLIGTGAAGFLGFSHNLTGNEREEDILKNLPIKIYYPESEEELENNLTNTYLEGKPTFIRI